MDSGFGGLTVAGAIIEQLPWESVLYFADSARGPYGSRSIETVRAYALECLDKVIAHQVKAIVIACNTASAAMLRDARERYDVPIIEVISPAVRQAAVATRNRRVGVICTEATKRSQAYGDAFAAAPDIAVSVEACPRFVEFVEQGDVDSTELRDVARAYLQPLKEAGVDTLILGCTHYPLLSAVIAEVMGPGVTLISSAAETARETAMRLQQLEIERQPRQMPSRHTFLTTGSRRRFQRIGQRFLEAKMTQVYSA
ncbi:glutamate racemase [Streptomyces sp. PBH53]|uniref:glutamate racemase n=1 Tax=Streptomyces sp. PBH53 TaxID=1577075 RepID=UPI0021C379A4|nr:glutamate racemase [Streptomyces sp. PBH53]